MLRRMREHMGQVSLAPKHSEGGTSLAPSGIVTTVHSLSTPYSELLRSMPVDQNSIAYPEVHLVRPTLIVTNC